MTSACILGDIISDQKMLRTTSISVLILFSVATGKKLCTNYIWRQIFFHHIFHFQKLIIIYIFLIVIGFPSGIGFEATHLFSPPLLFFSSDRFDLSGDVSNDGSTEKSLKIFVSPDDSSIRIKKDTNYNVTYNLEWNNNNT